MRRNEHDVPLTPAQSEAADIGLKAMIPVGRPLLDYILTSLADGGVRDVCIVVAAGETRIRRRYEHEVELQRLRVSFAEQASPTGTAHAILAARAFAGSEGFIVLNGDNLYSADAIAAMCGANGNAIAAYRAGALVARGNISRERLRAFAVVETGGRGELRRIIEKPGAHVRVDDDTLISMNLWAFTPVIFSACEHVERSSRGEFELISAVERVMQDGTKFRAIKLDDGVLDLTERRDIALVTARLKDVSVSL